MFLLTNDFTYFSILRRIGTIRPEWISKYWTTKTSKIINHPYEYDNNSLIYVIKYNFGKVKQNCEAMFKVILKCKGNQINSSMVNNHNCKYL